MCDAVRYDRTDRNVIYAKYTIQFAGKMIYLEEETFLLCARSR
jgi:hypothetical protein